MQNLKIKKIYRYLAIIFSLIVVIALVLYSFQKENDIESMVFNDVSEGAPPVGYTFSFKTEYNIHENFSFGYQIQKPIFTGESSLDGLFLNNLYLSLKL